MIAEKANRTIPVQIIRTWDSQIALIEESRLNKALAANPEMPQKVHEIIPMIVQRTVFRRCIIYPLVVTLVTMNPKRQIQPRTDHH